jgi:hypothetical protein
VHVPFNFAEDICLVVLVTQIIVSANSLLPQSSLWSNVPALQSFSLPRLKTKEKTREMKKNIAQTTTTVQWCPVVNVANWWWQIFTSHITILKGRCTLIGGKSRNSYFTCLALREVPNVNSHKTQQRNNFFLFAITYRLSQLTTFHSISNRKTNCSDILHQ